MWDMVTEGSNICSEIGEYVTQFIMQNIMYNSNLQEF